MPNFYCPIYRDRNPELFRLEDSRIMHVRGGSNITIPCPSRMYEIERRQGLGCRACLLHLIGCGAGCHLVLRVSSRSWTMSSLRWWNAMASSAVEWIGNKVGISKWSPLITSTWICESVWWLRSVGTTEQWTGLFLDKVS